MRDFWVYMLRCSDGRYYVGVTNDITYRIDQHQNGTSKTAYTYKRRPVKLVYSAQFNDINEAISWEKHIKRWSHAKKTALITADEKQLHDFSRLMTS